ncbi:MAG: imidazole glycerol phosphate synthase subunit HisH [Thaumarchaeota archaeon]|nr:imidazole glycerol phosphate synthase subunit HisH [Nitrososphaerota archaeon]
MCALIQILDYGSGNLFSIKDSLNRVSPQLKVKISTDYEEGRMDGLVLPGVGSFSSAQRLLVKNRPAILRDVSTKKMPILGICLGMQLMFEKSEEGKGIGLKLFKGNVVRFESKQNLKVPHMGWNRVLLKKDAMDNSNFCYDLPASDWAYFAHSFFPEATDGNFINATTRYGNQTFPSIIQNDNIVGTQFHPEKSGDFGFKIISNFARAVISQAEKDPAC